MGADVVEIDVHASRDGELVVMHDARVDRTTDGTGYLREMTIGQIRQLRIAGNHTVPTLEEVLLAVKGRAELMIELKVRNLGPGVVGLVRSVAPELPVYYASFLHPELIGVRELEPAARTIALLEGVPVSGPAFAVEAQATHAGIGFDSLEKGLVGALQKAGIGVFTYTVDDPRDIAYATSLGVDGLISNYPDRLR